VTPRITIEQELGHFPLASVEVLKQVSLLRRYDTKFVCGASPLDQLLAVLRTDYSVVSEKERLTSAYHTVYFDTDELRCFHDHRRGRRSRFKFRIRRYPERGQAFFEIKEKTNRGETRKMRTERPVDNGNEMSADEARLVGENTPFDPAELRAYLSTTFRRFTLVDIVRQERVTMDYELEFLKDGDRRGLSDLVVVEVKQNHYNRSSPVMKALRTLGVRPMRISKYCTGNALYAVERSEGFYREKLNQMSKVAHG